MKSLSPAAALVLTLACSESAPPAKAPHQVASAGEQQATDGNPAGVQPTGKNPDAGNLVISDRIRQACGIDDRAYFAYDSAHLSDAARGVLQQLVTCFSTGPLAGTPMKLVGHADPRGDEEYNLVLGGRRADAVQRVLSQLGLNADQITTTSRGELDARGSDEASWALDRKVEVKIDD